MQRCKELGRNDPTAALDGSNKRDTIVFQLQSLGNAVVTLSIKSHNLDISSITHDVTGTRMNGLTARIGGKVDAQGNVTACLDLDLLPWAAPLTITPNMIGVAIFGVSPTGGIQLPFIVSKVHYEAAVESAVSYNFDLQLNILAGSFAYGAVAA